MGGVWTSSWCSNFDSGAPSGLLVLVCRSVFQAQCLLTLSLVQLMPVSLVPAVLIPPKGFWLLFDSSLVASSMGQQAIGTSSFSSLSPRHASPGTGPNSTHESSAGSAGLHPGLRASRRCSLCCAFTGMPVNCSNTKTNGER